MNERIKELALQAGMILGDAGEFDMAKFMPKEVKFAELIVRECSGFVYNYPKKYLTRNQSAEICMSMEEHFGVEE